MNKVKKLISDIKEMEPIEQLKALEKRMMALAEESCSLLSKSHPIPALEKAKAASTKERLALKIRAQIEQSNPQDQIAPQNIDSSYFIALQLAISYHACKLYSESIAAYSVIIKNKVYVNGDRLRVNVANILMEQGKFGQALKMYRMALDQIPANQKSTK